jgi:ribosome maturation factor RimP
MLEKIKELVDDEIKDLNVHVDDSFISNEEGKKILNIVLDSDEIIDLNKVTDASRIINKIMDAHEELLQDCDELDIYSKEKGVEENE